METEETTVNSLTNLSEQHAQLLFTTQDAKSVDYVRAMADFNGK